MKKAILLVAVAVATMAAANVNAQDKKFWIGGSFGFQTTELNSLARTNTLSIMPEFGINLNDRWALGIGVGYERYDTKIANGIVIEGNDDINKINGLTVAPFARYTFLKWKAFDVFADGGITGLYADGVQDGSDLSVETVYVGLFINPGVSVRLSDHFALTGRVNVLNAGYTQITGPYATAQTELDKTNSWNASLNSPFKLDNFTLGIDFRF